mgnify:CR=1 FL=1
MYMENYEAKERVKLKPITYDYPLYTYIPT